ncbi:methylated-DNA--[protein]-cysteine S-methyltransferase [Virgibacillus siamensis]|uniref:methylated-DNA--[protein]-cysteine S-methyltransferase n=1 Tax=Virgibacillus siamensis TaxID=480071 RepID=UPI0011155A18|nr:methylated-DNA--[protein]-cysteine S-methyltransferase [Virgibacillus siamensis]
MELFYDEMDSPVGTLLLIGDGDKMLRIEYGTLSDSDDKMTAWANRYFDKPCFVKHPDKVKEAKSELQEYFLNKRQHFTIPFEFHGTPFQVEVWRALFDTIPFGATKTYKGIADTIGKPKAVRAVGGAVNKNPFSIVVPCHRVIGANGKMVGYNGGLDKKEYLLNHEIVEFG